MKNYYKINEISVLYNIGKDSLRYYEKLGLLNPKRDDNGYRLYSIQDIWKLNIIKDLRNLNFPMEKIKAYIENRTVQNTLDILNEEKNLLTKKIEELNLQKAKINQRIKSISTDVEDNNLEKIELIELEERKVIKLNDTFSRDAEVDFLIKKLHKKYEEKIYVLGNNYLGVTMNLDKVRNNIYNAYTSVFFILDKSDINYDYILPSGKYIVLSYKGSYNKTKKFLPLMLDYIKSNNYQIKSDPIELYKIDVHETSNVEEYLTQLQIAIK